MQHQTVTTICDKCGKTITGSDGQRVTMPAVIPYYGDHDDFPLIADLCGACTIKVVTNAFEGWAHRPAAV